MSATDSSAALEGTKVIEVATMVAVPQATQLLASYGAEVIKIEDTATGDLLRHYGSAKNGLGAWFTNVNSGKRSVALDLKSAPGREILTQLAAEADVLIEGFRAGVMARLGLGYDELAAVNPRLIFCSSSGFGPDGPYHDRPVYDPLIQALSGWASTQHVDGNPSLIRAMAADKIGAYNNAQAIMAALLKRDRNGRGCHIETNMLDANLAFCWPDAAMHCTLTDTEGVDHRPNLLASYRLYTASDGWVSIAIGTDQQWQAACSALDRPDLAAREDLRTTADRSARMVEWYDTIDDMASAFPQSEVVARLLSADVPAAPVLDVADIFDDAHIRATHMLSESRHPVVGGYRHPRSRNAQLGEDIALAPAPTWGQHTDEVLLEAGFSPEQISAWSSAGHIRAN